MNPDDFLEDLLAAPRSVRREIKYTVDGNVPLATSAEAYLLTHDGGIDIHQVEIPRTYPGCQCTIEKRRGGECQVCQAQTCSEHFAFCNDDTCGKPLCRQHTYYLTTKGARHAYCPRCHDTHKRRQRWHTLLCLVR